MEAAKKVTDLKPKRETFTHDPAFQTVLKLANTAVQLATDYQTPPSPKAFEVWYTYASDSDAKMNSRIDNILKKEGYCTSFEIDQIHNEFFLKNEQEEKQEHANAKLESQVGEILSLVKSHLASQDNYSGELDNNKESLLADADAQNVRAVINQLIEENSHMRDEAEQLSQHLASTQEKIQEIRAELEESKKTALEDPLTGVGNRRRFDYILKREMDAAIEQNLPLCLVMADLDYFKQVNDKFGHFIGDQILKYFASILKNNVKGMDSCARYGGEEFAIILPKTKLGAADQLVNKIRLQLAETNLVVSKNKKPLGQVTASFGVTEIQEKDNAETFIKRADANLYVAKKSGRNRVISK